MPSEHQLKLLKKLLLDFYIFQKEHHQDNKRTLEFLDENIKDPLYEACPEFHRCKIDLLDIESGFPIAHRNEKNQVYAIQLRPITLEQTQTKGIPTYADIAKKKKSEDMPRKILLGCGNNPTSVCFHYPTNMDEFSKCCKDYFEGDDTWRDLIIEQQKQEIQFGHYHHHHGYITIDPNIVMNPTIVSEFGELRLPFLPNNYFDSIEDEGINLERKKFYECEKQRLLKVVL